MASLIQLYVELDRRHKNLLESHVELKKQYEIALKNIERMEKLQSELEEKLKTCCGLKCDCEYIPEIEISEQVDTLNEIVEVISENETTCEDNTCVEEQPDEKNVEEEKQKRRKKKDNKTEK